jgi:hypothetical protein
MAQLPPSAGVFQSRPASRPEIRTLVSNAPDIAALAGASSLAVFVKVSPKSENSAEKGPDIYQQYLRRGSSAMGKL